MHSKADSIFESYAHCRTWKDVDEMTDEMKKIDELNCVIDNLQSEIEHMDAEIARLKAENKAMRTMLYREVDKEIAKLTEAF